MKSAVAYLKELLHSTATICRSLFVIMIPVIVIVKILQELDMVRWLAAALEPVMGWVGLPGSMGLVWATTLLTNLYGGITAYLAIAADAPLSVAQITILSSMMLIAHALPIEVGICAKVGLRWYGVALLRIGGALIYGICLRLVFNGFSLCQEVSRPAITVPPPPDSLGEWAGSQLFSLGKIFVIVLLLVLLLRLLKAIKITELIETLLMPILTPIGISKNAANVTTIGMVLGLSYGGGLIIDEVEKGHLQPRDVVLSIALMSLCHSVIEDTLLMAALGGTLWGLLLGRMVFTIALMIPIGLIIHRLSDSQLRRVYSAKQPGDEEQTKEACGSGHELGSSSQH